MKKKNAILLFIAEFIALCLLHIPTADADETVLSTIAFPFLLLGKLTGKLAAIGTLGNAFAVMLAATICLLPILHILKNLHKKERLAEHAALLIFSALAALVLPCLADPDRLTSLLSVYTQDMLSPVQTGMCLALWSAIICFAVLRLLRLLKSADKQQLMQYATRLLTALCAFFTACIAVSCVGTLIEQITAAQAQADKVLAMLLFAANSLAYILDIAVIFSMIEVLQAYSNETRQLILKAKKMSHICCISLAVITASNAAANTVHILLIKHISNFSVSLNIPLVSIGFTVAVLLCARLLIENKQLNDDNELFI